MPTKPRALVPPPPFAAFRTAATAQRRPAGPDARPVVPPPPTLSGAAARPKSAAPAVWPGAPAPSPAAGVMQRQRAAFTSVSIQPVKLPPRPVFPPWAAAVRRQPAWPVPLNPSRVVQRAAAKEATATAASTAGASTATATAITAPLQDADKQRNALALKRIYNCYYKNGVRVALGKSDSTDKIETVVYNLLGFESKSQYLHSHLMSLESLLNSGSDGKYSVQKQKQKKLQDSEKEAISNFDLLDPDYYHVFNKNCEKSNKIGTQRRIVFNLRSQQDGLKLANMFIRRFRSMPAETATAVAPAATAATSAGAASAASVNAPATTDFARHIREFKVYLGNIIDWKDTALADVMRVEPIKLDKFVVYYDHVDGPKADWVRDGIVAAVQATGVKPGGSLAAFYATVAPGIAWAEEPKYHSEMKGSFTGSRAALIAAVVKAHAQIADVATFLSLVMDQFFAKGVDMRQPHLHFRVP